ncbi:MAG: hypothetical protein EP216_02390, partial [Epsilonproteobacteria bacterium]
MSTFLKSSLVILALFIIGIYTFFTSTSGKQYIRDFVSYKLTQKSGLEVIVNSIDLEQYPEIVVEMNIEKKAKLILKGLVTSSSLDMDYKLISDCIATDVCKIDDNINIDGHVNGPYSRLAIQGEGKALDGNVSYRVLKYTDKVENLSLILRDINSTKLFTLMGYEELVKGKANVDVNFKFMEQNNRKGSFVYDVQEGNLSGLPLHLHAQVHIDGMLHTFSSDITSPYLNLNISDGQYDQGKKLARANYILDIKDLSQLEPLLGYTYLGPFYSTGEMIYNNHFMITGHSKTYGGMLDYYFERDGLYIDLDAVSFMRFMKIFPYPPLLTADVTGNMYYNFIQKTLVVNTELENAKVAHTKLIRLIRKKSTVNLKRETFNNSHMDATYHDGLLVGDLKLRNKKNHLYLSSLKMNAKENSIDTYFDVKMQSREFSGKVYGAIDDPKVN